MAKMFQSETVKPNIWADNSED